MSATLKTAKPKSDHNQSVKLRAFVYKEDKLFISYCLELGLASQGNTPQEAMDNLSNTIVFFVQSELREGKKIEHLFRRPPLWARIKLAQVLGAVIFSAISGKFSNTKFLDFIQYDNGDVRSIECLPA